MPTSNTESDQPQIIDDKLPIKERWFNSPNAFEEEDTDFDDDEWCKNLPEHPRDTKKRLQDSGEWYGPAGAKVLYVLSRLRYDLLLNADELRPFRKRIIKAHLAHCKVCRNDEVENGPTGRCSCFDETNSILPKSVTYHLYRKAGLWAIASLARTAFVRRLEAEGNSPSRANELSWRLLEDLLFWGEIDDGFDADRIKAELNAMLVFGEERKYLQPGPSLAVEQTASKADASLLFKMFRTNALGWLPTTVMHAYKLLELWDLAERLLQRQDSDRGELGDHSTSSTWQELGYWIATHRDRNELQESLRKRIRRLDVRLAST